jgi:hypothetical protein
MFKPFNNSTTKYRRYQHTPQIYDEKAEKLKLRKAELEDLNKNPDFDPINHRLKDKKNGFSMHFDLILMGILFLSTLIFSPFINDFFKQSFKYGEFGIYFLLILLGFGFTRMSKRKNG